MTEAGDSIVIAGAGIAGLSAAYRLQGKSRAPFVIFEKAPEVGGYSRTVRHGDFRFDLGGHRFYTKKAHVQKLVEDLIAEDLVTVDRVSRILFRGRYFDYPLSVFNTLKALGILGATHAVFDYGRMKAGKAFSGNGPQETFEQWALNRFGRYLYEAFFKVYTEKTWGVPCTELSADFAEQRIKGLSFREAVKEAILRKGDSDSLVRRFIYPRYGFGLLTDRMAEAVGEPNRILTSHAVVRIEHGGGRVTAVTAEGPDGPVRQGCGEFVNCIPIDELVRLLEPAPPAEVLAAAERLRFRSLVILFLVLDKPQLSPDHWIYVPSPEISFCRLHEPKNWSADMAPPDRTGIVLEFFCQEGDECWNRPQEDLVAQAARDLETMGLLEPGCVSDSVALRLRKAYPVYNMGYAEHMRTLTDYLSGLGNLHNIGRNATFRYTSSDHYIDMGLKAAENLLGHEHDLDAIGRESGYAETWHKGERGT
jgi:protoporphyrinogen oxidase